MQIGLIKKRGFTRERLCGSPQGAFHLWPNTHDYQVQGKLWVTGCCGPGEDSGGYPVPVGISHGEHRGPSVERVGLSDCPGNQALEVGLT